MQTKRSFFTIFMIALAALALVFATAAPSDAGWYKKAKKAAKKAAKKVEQNIKEAGHNVEKEVRTGAIGQAVEKAKGDVSREGGRFAGDVSRESKRLGGDVFREGQKFHDDVMREGGKLYADSKAQGKKGISFGSFKLGENIAGGGQQLWQNTEQGWRQGFHNTQRGLQSGMVNVTGQPDLNYWFKTPFGRNILFEAYAAAPLIVFFPLTNTRFSENLQGGFDQLGKNWKTGVKHTGDAIDDQLKRGPQGSRKATDNKKSDNDMDLITGRTTVTNALTENKRKAIEAPELSDTPVAIFRAETDTGMGDSTGGSDTISRERTTTGPGSSTGSSSESSGLGSSQTTGKKESTSTPSTGGSKVGGRPAGRR